MTTLLRKSLLTSSVASRTDLCQREAISPSFPHSGGFPPRAGRRGDAEVKAKRGEGRFYDIYTLTYDLISKNIEHGSEKWKNKNFSE
jgi:hypothetical protein